MYPLGSNVSSFVGIALDSNRVPMACPSLACPISWHACMWHHLLPNCIGRSNCSCSEIL